MEALKKAIDAFVNAFKIEDLRKKLLFTLAVLIIGLTRKTADAFMRLSGEVESFGDDINLLSMS